MHQRWKSIYLHRRLMWACREEAPSALGIQRRVNFTENYRKNEHTYIIDGEKEGIEFKQKILREWRMRERSYMLILTTAGKMGFWDWAARLAKPYFRLSVLEIKKFGVAVVEKNKMVQPWASWRRRMMSY